MSVNMTGNIMIDDGKNRYGLDVSYFNRWFGRVFNDLSNYMPSEFARELARMSKAADSDVVMEFEFSKEKWEEFDNLYMECESLKAELTLTKHALANATAKLHGSRQHSIEVKIDG